MASSFKVGAVDLDDWFDPYVQGTKPGLTGYKAGAQDLRDRYAPIVYGTTAPVTGYSVTGVGDLNKLFAAKGSAAYKLPCDGQTASIGEVLTNGQNGYAHAQFIIDPDGTYTLQTMRSPNPSVNDTTVLSRGTWNTLGGAASGYQVRYTLSNIQFPTGNSAGTSHPNAATVFTTITDVLLVEVAASGSYTQGTRYITADLKIELMRISDGTVFSVTNVQLGAHVDGSV